MPNLRPPAHPHVAVAALTVDLTANGLTGAPASFRLLPLGRFKAADGSGRPLDVKDGWLLDSNGARRLAALSVGRASRRVIDFEHQTLRAADNGQPAPAAGWFSRLEARADGLWAVDVEWTAQAARMIADKQYRYISPVFPYDKRTGAVLGIAHAALTNDPGLDGLTDLAAMTALAVRFLPLPPPPEKETSPMKTLLAALGLAETATEAEAVAALAALRTAHGATLAALTASSVNAAPDPAQYVAVATLAAVQGELAGARTELAALKATQQAAEVDGVVVAALAAGKLTPATEGWARELGKTDLAALKSFITAAPAVVAPGTTQSGGQGAVAATQTTDVDLAVMKALGLTAAQFATGKREV